MTIELHAIFKGNVQGVGFRWTVSRYAEIYRLQGTVKNLENGDVEVYAIGSKEKLEKFIHEIKNKPGIADITSVSVDYRESEKKYSGFQII